MRPTFDLDPSLSPSVAAGVRTVVRKCRQHLPSWCDHVTVRAADRDIEALTAEQPAPLIALPNREGRQLRLVIRSTWEQTHLTERHASLLRWFVLEELLTASKPVLRMIRELPPAQGGSGAEGDLTASELYLGSLAGLADLLVRRAVGARP